MRALHPNQPVAEPILEPDLPIVDAHHHLWCPPAAVVNDVASQESTTARAITQLFRRYPRYLFDELKTDLDSGHNIQATVFMTARAMYRASGPLALRSVGEIEFANGIAAMAYSETFGKTKVCAAIIGGADLTLGDTIAEVLRAHVQAGGSRYRGIRAEGTMYDEDIRIVGPQATAHRLLDPKFRAGLRWVQELGLTFDVLLLEPQLPELIDLARAFPATQIILNHTGGPLGVGRYTRQREQRFPLWRANMRTLATCENVAVKLGGLANPFCGFSSTTSLSPVSSTQLAEEWRPYIDTCIEAFGVHRCMFESNFPVDSSGGTYAVLWNAFKRVAAGASQDEKTALFSGTATRIYRLDL